jgi:endonuclease G
MSNVTPQGSLLNQKLWNVLEQAERRFVLEKNAPLYVVTGPLYEREMPKLPGADEAHTVPSGYFKVIAFDGGEGIQTAAVIAEQDTPPREDYCDHTVVIDEVERRARLDIFPLLSVAQARELEGRAGTFFEVLGCLEGP